MTLPQVVDTFGKYFLSLWVDLNTLMAVMHLMQRSLGIIDVADIMAQVEE